ncbi:MAG: DUF3619 family protein [Gammaproteobacteria bacterium]|jgi:hypothetical protein
MATDDNDRQLITRLKRQLDVYEEDVDALTAARLQAARHRALAAVPAHNRSAYWLPAGAFATVAVMVLTVVLWRGDDAVPVPVLAADDWEILVAGELQLIEELDFYDWLAEEDTTG